jgi:transcriptional regulator with XRE-family HTH domain
VPRTEESEAVRKKEGSRLKNLRQALDMTVRDLAKEFNVAHSSISQWENGDHAIPGPVLKLIEIYEQRLKGNRK